MKKTFKFRIFPKRAQIESLLQILNTCRLLYNCALEQRRYAWKQRRRSLSAYDQTKQLPEVRKEFPEFKAIYAQILQDVVFRVERAFRGFFNRCKTRNGKAGYPRFRSADRYDSFTYPQAYDGCVKLRGKKVWLSKIGAIRMKQHRPVEGNIKTVSIKREGKRWYLIISCDNVPARPLPASDKAVGIDVGLEHFATLSDETVIENPRYLKRFEEKLKVAQQRLSLKKHNTSARRKAKEVVARISRKIANQRKDFLHKTARHIVNNYGLIAVENLNVQNLLQKKGEIKRLDKALHRGIIDASWGMFVAFLAYKAEEAGRRLVKVEPRGTTRTCSRCGQVLESLPLSQRFFSCPYCSLHIHRDLNAAKNIVQRAGRFARSGISLMEAPDASRGERQRRKKQ